ncbi:MAG: redoxin domain-containing protein [Blastocatellia bacterium]
MMYRVFLSLIIALMIAGFHAKGAAQTVSLAPERPIWGESLKIIYDPAAPEAAFGLDEEVRVRVYQLRDDYSAAREEMIVLRREGAVLAGEIQVAKGVGHLQLAFFRPPNTYDARSRRILMAYRPDGEPARGANLSQAASKDYLEWVRKELALYPDNYAAYRAKWRAASSRDPANVRAIIEADMAEVGPKVKGEPLSWLHARMFGYLLLRQEEKSRELLRKMVQRFPDAKPTRLALGDYWYQAIVQRIHGEGPTEVAQMICAVMKRAPGSDFARQTIGDFSFRKETPLEVTEAISRIWRLEQPRNPMPYYYLASALRAHERSPEQIVPLLDRALDLFVRKTVWEYDLSSQEVDANVRFAFQMSAEMLLKQGRHARAISAIKAAQAMSRDQGGDLFLLEGRIWLNGGMRAKAQAAYLEAWQRGVKEAEPELREIYLQEKGAPDEFAAWLERKSGRPGSKAESKKGFPEFQAVSLKGVSYDLASLRGKVVVLNFWYIGCGPCKAEMPDLNRLVKENAGREIVFLAPALDDAESLRAFLKEAAFDYEIIPDSQSLTNRLEIKAFPVHCVLNQDGEVELMLRGGGEKNVEQVRHVVRRLLSSGKE